MRFTLPEVATKPTVATMYANHVMQDKASGVTFMETVTTSIGRVALRQTQLAIQNPQLTIEDITDLPSEGNNNCLWAEQEPPSAKHRLKLSTCNKVKLFSDKSC